MAPLYDLPYIVDRLDEFFKLPSNDLRARPLGFFSLNHGLERDHHGRRRSNKQKPFLYRCTRTRWDKVTEIAKAKSAGANEDDQAVTYTAVIDEAIDLLDAVMRGEKRVI